jgi:hypothetical protein
MGRGLHPFDQEFDMHRIRIALLAATLVAAPNALASATAPLPVSADDCTQSCCAPVGDCCDTPCDAPCE